MESFVLLAYASLVASRTLLQWLLACLNFTLDSEDLLFNPEDSFSNLTNRESASVELQT